MEMLWLLLFFGVVGFFFLVGKLTSKSEKHLISISTRETTKTYKTKQDRYLPWGDEPYHNTHLFKLFGTDAGLGWNDSDDMVYVYCISRFSKGEPQTTVHSRYYYCIKDGIWHSPPKGAANECLKEIKKVLKLKEQRNAP